MAPRRKKAKTEKVAQLQAAEPRSGVIRLELDISKDYLHEYIKVGGVKWSVSLHKNKEGLLSADCYGVCWREWDRNPWAWRVVVDVQYVLLNSDSSNNIIKQRKCVTGTTDTHIAFLQHWSDLIDVRNGFVKEDKITIECTITLSNMATFLIQGQRIHAEKDFLALHSTYFNVLFTSNFNEKNLDEIEIGDVTPRDLKDFICSLYVRDDARYTADGGKSRESRLVLGDRFGVKALSDEFEEFLIASDNDSDDEDEQDSYIDDDDEDYVNPNKYTREEKRQLADQYHLFKLKMRCDDKTEENETKEKEENIITTMKASEHVTYEGSQDLIASGSFPTDFFFDHYSYNNVIISEEYSYFKPSQFDVGGLMWSLDGTCRLVNDKFHLSICLIANGNRTYGFNWNAEGTVEIEIAHPNPEKLNQPIKRQYGFSFDNSTRTAWTDEFIVDGIGGVVGKNACNQCHVDTRLFMKKRTGVMDVPAFDFTSPSPLGDVTLLVDGKQIFVNKMYLSSISSVFRKMFIGDSSGTNEFILDGMEYQDALDFFKWIFPSHTQIFEADRLEWFLIKAKLYKVSIIADDIKRFLHRTPCNAYLAQKIVLYFSGYQIIYELSDIVKWVRDELEEDDVRKFLLPIIKKSQCYKDMKSENKVELLEWIVEDAMNLD